MEGRRVTTSKYWLEHTMVESGINSLCYLPVDILRIIIGNLDYKSQQCLKMSCKYLCDIVSDECYHQYKLTAKWQELQVNISCSNVHKQPILSKLVSEDNIRGICDVLGSVDSTYDNYNVEFTVTGIMSCLLVDELLLVVYVDSNIQCNYTTDSYYEFGVTANFANNQLHNTLHGTLHIRWYKGYDFNQLYTVYDHSTKIKQCLIRDTEVLHRITTLTTMSLTHKVTYPNTYSLTPLNK